MNTRHFWFGSALLPDGWTDNVRVDVSDGLITDMASGPARDGDERHAVAVSGLGNVHSHAFQRGMAGLSERRGPTDDDFWSWREVMYRFLDRLDPDAVEAIAALAFAEMLESGFTRVGEFHYLHNAPDGRPYDDQAELSARIVAAAAETGIGLTLLPVFYAHGGFGGAAPVPGQRRFLTDLDGFAALRAAGKGLLPADGVIGTAPHSLRAVTPAQLAALTAMAGDGPIHIHAAEQVREVEECLAVLGTRPVQWLLDNAQVDRRWCLIHATHMTRAETDGLARSGAVAGLCPVTEANLGDGIFPGIRYMAAGGVLAVGTDSNILVDAAGELRALEYSQRLGHRGRNLMVGGPGASVGRTLFEAARAGGDRALGVAGGLAVGRSADWVTLDAADPALVGRAGDLLLDGWIFAARRPVVDTVVRAGRTVVSGGRHVARDRIEARYARTIRPLFAA